MSKRCKARRKGEEECRSWALHGSEYCWFHDSKIEERRKAARVNGGRRSRVYNRHIENGKPPAEFQLKTLRQVSGFLEFLINQTLQRRLDTKLANTLTYQAQALKSCIESSEIEERLEKLEEEVYANQRVQGQS